MISWVVLPPILLTSPILIVAAASLTGDWRLGSIAVSAGLGIAFIGGALELYVIYMIRSMTDVIVRGSRRDFLNMAVAALYLGLYYALVGVLLIARELRSSLEYSTGRMLEETRCGRLYNTLLFLVTLGMYLAPFQACVYSSVSSAFEHASVGLGLEGDEGEEDSGGGDGLVHDDSPRGSAVLAPG